MSEARVHTGGCHCGAVRFEATIDASKGLACNCSICGRSGTILGFIPGAQFTLLSGGEVLKDYQFAKHHIHHKFCTTCGVKSFANGAGPDGQETIAVNLRCLDDIDLSKIEVTHYDGKSL